MFVAFLPGEYLENNKDKGKVVPVL